MKTLALSLLLLLPGNRIASQICYWQQQGKKWSDMDYGPFMTHSFETAGKDIATKGIKVRLGPDGACMIFDANCSVGRRDT